MSSDPVGAEPDRGAQSFDHTWWAYEAGRPPYPSALFDAIRHAMHLDTGAKVLDVGAGTGNFTVSMAHRGMRVTAVEPSANMLRVLARRLPESCVTIQRRFEDCDLPGHAFDAIFVCHAWHWLNKTTRISHSAALLRPRGCLCIVYNVHLRDEDPLFGVRRKEIYARWAPEIEHLDPPGVKLESARTELMESAIAGTPMEVSVCWQHRFTAAEFTALLASYSNHAALPPRRRSSLLTEVRQLISDRFGGAVTQTFSSNALISRMDTDLLVR
jgi:SAM-dependent methyltransferase